MKRLIVLTVLFLTVFTLTRTLTSAQQCAKIKDGTILDSSNTPIGLGFDQYGYNYQARMFNGTYSSSDRVDGNGYYGDTTSDYIDDSLIMKWSDDWLSNMDCYAPFGKLDRGGNTGQSRGWLTNMVEGDYIGSDGDSHHYTYFTKIVYVGPPPAGVDPFASTRIWGTFATIEEVYNDPFGGYHGVDKTKLGRPAGFGAY